MIPKPFVIRISSDDHCRLSDLFKVGTICVGGKEFSVTEFNIGARDAVAFAQEAVKAEWQWGGEGLPPIGSHVVVHDDGSLVYGQGESGEVLAHVDGCAVVRMSYGLGCFLPRCLRTPEQIAADERLHKLRNAHTAIARTLDSFMGDIPAESVSRQTIEAMIDAGYVKGE